LRKISGFYLHNRGEAVFVICRNQSFCDFLTSSGLLFSAKELFGFSDLVYCLADKKTYRNVAVTGGANEALKNFFARCPVGKIKFHQSHGR
jgi:hypothetical protein